MLGRLLQGPDLILDDKFFFIFFYSFFVVATAMSLGQFKSSKKSSAHNSKEEGEQKEILK
jgi:hypothetical protein